LGILFSLQANSARFSSDFSRYVKDFFQGYPKLPEHVEHGLGSAVELFCQLAQVCVRFFGHGLPEFFPVYLALALPFDFPVVVPLGKFPFPVAVRPGRYAVY